jgi:hypothetical protein
MDAHRPASRTPVSNLAERRVSGARHLISAAVVRCQSSLQRQLERGVEIEELRGSVSEFADTVRREQVPPQRALALFKEMVYQLPEVAPKAPSERNEVVKVLTQMAIEEYYRAP